MVLDQKCPAFLISHQLGDLLWFFIIKWIPALYIFDIGIREARYIRKCLTHIEGELLHHACAPTLLGTQGHQIPSDAPIESSIAVLTRIDAFIWLWRKRVFTSDSHSTYLASDSIPSRYTNVGLLSISFILLENLYLSFSSPPCARRNSDGPTAPFHPSSDGASSAPSDAFPCRAYLCWQVRVNVRHKFVDKVIFCRQLGRRCIANLFLSISTGHPLKSFLFTSSTLKIRQYWQIFNVSLGR